MSLASADLPSDPDALRAFALACQNELAAATAELQAAKLAVQLRTLEIEKLKLQIAKLRRMQFGRSSERLARHIEQLELRLEELEAGEAEEISKTAAEDQPFPIREADRPKRKPLPDHLPRHAIVHEPVHDGACTCPACGGDMARLGEDVTEVLDYIPGRFRVIRHVRPKYACRRCDAITQAPAAVYFYSPDRGGEHPAAHLAHITGFLQADAYSGFAALYEPRKAGPGLPMMPAITEVACWAHCRRSIFDVWQSTKSTVAKAALDRIAQFYASRTRPASPRQTSAWRIAPISFPCSMRSSPGHRPPSESSRPDRSSLRRCATSLNAAPR